jgi:hypothetical protein
MKITLEGGGYTEGNSVDSGMCMKQFPQVLFLNLEEHEDHEEK